MSLEEVLEEIREMSGKVSALSNDVEWLKEKDRIREEGGLEEPRSRSRSPHRDGRDRPRSRSRSSRHPDTEPRGGSTESRRRGSPEPRRHWADSDPDGPTVYPPIHFSDEEEDDSQLVEVSEETHKLLSVACTRSVSNEMRKRTRGRYKLPKVEATKTPRLDSVIKTLAPQGAKNADKDLAKLQTLILS